MNITRENTDELNAVVTVDIAKEDYNEKVQTVLQDYRKSANIPGFRKGHVPMGLVQKQYGKAILADEVNKLLQSSLQNYLTEEKLEVLGNPLPKNQDDLNWDEDNFKFEFELGLSPKFELDLNPKKEITAYKIVADDKMLDNQVKTIQKQYGKIKSQDEIVEGVEVTGSFVNEDAEVDKHSTVEVNKFADAPKKAFIGKKEGDTVTVNTKGLFAEDADFFTHLGLKKEEAEEKNAEVTFKIEEINLREPAELSQELFDKLYGEDAVKSVDELKAKIKEEAEAQFEQQSDQQLLNDVTETLIEETTFDLPSEFLTRWIQNSGDEELTEKQAKAEYERSEKGLRYQLIEGKIIADNEMQITFEEIKAYAKEMIKAQMAQYGQADPEEKQLDDIAARILSNQDEVKRLSEQLMNKKLLDFFKEKVKTKTKEVSFDDFVKEAYK
ncbi:MAG TPA: trigger factor [Leeuwenhoekiella sp.]|nr:trigger factor [Leeuwenhoekiella sp.]